MEKEIMIISIIVKTIAFCLALYCEWKMCECYNIKDTNGTIYHWVKMIAFYIIAFA